MLTDDERREVARRLRGLHLIGAIANHDGCYAAADTADRLADLIDPGDMLYVTYSRSTCGPDGMAYMVKVRHRARGLERDFYAVDLEKLLEVLDEMEITVKCTGPDVYRGYVENWANEVREALGVEE